MLPALRAPLLLKVPLLRELLLCLLFSPPLLLKLPLL
jgi:hypothetical protein